MFILRTLFAASYNKQIEFQPLVVLELRNRIDHQWKKTEVLISSVGESWPRKEQVVKSKTKNNPCPCIRQTKLGCLCCFFSSIIRNQKLRKTHVLKFQKQ